MTTTTKTPIPVHHEVYPESFTENAQVVLKRRYFGKDREGNVLEDVSGIRS